MRFFNKNFLNRIVIKTVFKRRAFFFIFDILLISLGMYASFWLRFNGQIPVVIKESLFLYILLALVVKLSFLIVFNLYDISWRFVSINELIRILKALSLSSLTLGMMLFLLREYMPFRGFPRSIILLDYLISLLFIGSFRVSKRILLEGLKATLKLKRERAKVLIVGAGNAGEQIAREMLRDRNSDYLPVGFVDDDPAKKGINIHGIKVLGTREKLPQIFKDYEIDQILIAIPSAHSKEIRKIVQIIRKTGIDVAIKILPSATDLINEKVKLSDIHEIKLEDLLGRSPVKIDLKAIRNFIQDKRVLITGAGGSIGSELGKTILQFNPAMLIALDNDETDIFHFLNNSRVSRSKIVPVVGDIKDEKKMVNVFEKFNPKIVVHSAAYKHVPVLESYPEEAVKTNILGTKILAELSLKHNITKFIFISTDKAINPTSIMGATKRVGEEMIKFLNQMNKTKFISVRFGNVLGSRGSVIPIFKKQIQSGGPLTVTHPEMKRYFMVTSEAVLLVLEASAIGSGGEVFVLDMGEPIKILDLAKEMIRLSGYEPDRDIPIVFSNIRPGEKLYEEILSSEEGVESTKYEKILLARNAKVIDSEVLIEKINFLIETSYQYNKTDEIIKLLKEIVPSYKPSEKELPLHFW